MAYKLPREPSVSESLQVVALAGRQVIGSTFSTSDLRKLMSQTHEQQQRVESFVGIAPDKKKNLKEWVTDPSDPQLLNEWLDSSVWIAETLVHGTTLSGTYKFYRQDQFPQPGSSFKNVFNTLKKEIKDTIKDNPNFARTTAGRIYDNIEISDDKWNPADIVAVKTSLENQWKQKLSPEGFLRWRSTMKKTMKDDLKSFARLLGKRDNKLRIVDAMEDLYEYNKLITAGMQQKQFVPISLKKATQDNPQAQSIFVKEPADLKKYFDMTITFDKVEMKPKTKKAIVRFKISGLKGSDGDYYFDMRGFEPTASIADIQIQLMQGTNAAHGKITLPVTTQQIKLSGGNKAFKQLVKKKKEIFAKYYTSRTAASNEKKRLMQSSIHGFTDYRIFRQLQREVYDATKNKKDPQLATLDNDLDDLRLWGEYVEWLSEGRTTKKQFMQFATGDSFYSSSAASKVNFETDTKGNVVFGPKRRKLDLAHTQVKYMKDKVQSYEAAWMVIPDGAQLSDTIKNNIMKSMWMYAASKGFAIFKTPASTFYMLSGPYVKCAA
tara:strand:- start:16 stop:1662 length:1647 start_codon:yes stop_codon:yes gene_type:complete